MPAYLSYILHVRYSRDFRYLDRAEKSNTNSAPLVTYFCSCFVNQMSSLSEKAVAPIPAVLQVLNPSPIMAANQGQRPLLYIS